MEYFILKPDGEQTGTYSIEQIRDMLEKGVIGSDTQYWHEGIPEWRPIDHIEESLNFQPPAPTTSPTVSTQPKKRPPASRAIPRPASPPEKSHSPPVESPKLPERPPAVITFPPSRDEPPARPDIPQDTRPAAIRFAPAARPWYKRVSGWVLYVINVTLAALAIHYAEPAVHYVSDSLQRKVTLTSADTYALVDRSQIKSFAADMRNSPATEALQHQIEKTTDPNSRMRLQIGLEKTKTWHINEVEGRYLGTGQAETIEPGTYRLLDYLDENGDSTTPRPGNPAWLAIVYKGHTVYAYQAPDSSAPTASP